MGPAQPNRHFVTNSKGIFTPTPGNALMNAVTCRGADERVVAAGGDGLGSAPAGGDTRQPRRDTTQAVETQ